LSRLWPGDGEWLSCLWIAGLKPDRAAQMADQRWVKVSSPSAKEIERLIPFAPVSSLIGFD